MDLSEWISPFNQVEPKAEGLRVDHLGRILIAEAGTGKLLRVTPDARKLEVLADSYDGYRFTTVKDLAIGQGDDLFVSSPFSYAKGNALHTKRKFESQTKYCTHFTLFLEPFFVA